jgi:hypothetical protein
MLIQHSVGLARTCEIFGVSELVLSNIKVLEEKQFQSLSVTAEKWLAIKEVQYCVYMCVHITYPPNSILAWCNIASGVNI